MHTDMDPGHDLSSQEAAARLRRDGPNQLPLSRPLSSAQLLLDVASEPMFLLLVACGAIYMVLGDRGEALMLLGFVFLVIAITFFQQRRTERSLSALRDLSSPRALVIRDGRQQRIAGRDLVAGDIVLLAEGDRVPADMDLLQSSNLTVDESMLTGESVPVAKHASRTGGAPGAGAQESRVFSGTLVTQGMARGRVSATGERSALGRIGASLAQLGGELTPIQLETRRIVKIVAAAGLALAACLALAYYWTRGDWLHGVLAGLTLAMAVLPEELPVILTLFLGLGAWRLANEKILARSIPAIELLGATTVLCVDKTGTLTSNRMVVRRLWTEEAAYDCTAAAALALPEELHRVLEYAVLASHRQAFDPMEAAIGSAGATLLADTEHLHGDWTLIDDYPLSRDMLAMSRVWQSPDRQERLIAAKGAPEAIVDLCHMAPQRAAAIAAQVSRLAEEGMRVLGVACATFPATPLPDKQHDFDFAFLGLVGLEDPVRPEVPAAIADCHAAGIRVVMITGDHPATAASIARQAGIGAQAAPLTGGAIAALDQAALAARLAATDIYCRIAPEQKLRLVQAFRARGDVVAMTGDGVNDAPALKAANIGVAMGARGTDVAREAAALVLLDDDFGSLLTALRHGRRLFTNLRKAIGFIVAVHVPIVGLSVLPVMLGWPMLLMPVHILFLQMIIDPACSIVFEAEPIEAGAMTLKPRRPDARLFDLDILIRGLCQGAGLLAILGALYAQARHAGQSDDAGRTVTFIAMVLCNLALIYTSRSIAPFRWGRARPVNHYFRWIALATVLLLALVIGMPVIRSLFGFVLPDWDMLFKCAAATALGTIWFELVKAGMARWRAPAPVFKAD